MGMIRNHLKQMKVEQPLEYLRLLRGYENEDDFVRDALGLPKESYTNYKKMRRGRVNYGQRGFNN